MVRAISKRQHVSPDDVGDERHNRKGERKLHAAVKRFRCDASHGESVPVGLQNKAHEQDAEQLEPVTSVRCCYKSQKVWLA